MIIKELPKSKIRIEIELSSEEFAFFKEKTFEALSKELKVNGFRSGKVPKEIAEQKIGEEKRISSAVETAIREKYSEALKENNIEVISQPKVEIIKTPPKDDMLSFSIEVGVFPKVELPNIEKASIKRKQVLISEKDIEDALKWIQKSRAKFTVKNEPAETGDFVEVIFSSPQIENKKEHQDAFILGEGRFIPGFEDEIKGLRRDQEKQFTLRFPKEFPQKDLADKEVEFFVKIKSVQKMELPVINDEFAKSLGSLTSIQELKENIKQGLIKEKEFAESQRIRTEALNKILNESKFETPEALVEEEQKRSLEELKQDVEKRLNITYQQYLEKNNKTEEEVLKNLYRAAEIKVKRYIVLKEIVKKENIQASEQEITEEINKILKKYPDTETAKKNLDINQLREYTKEVITSEKALARLESLASE